MDSINAPTTTALTTELLDDLADSRTADQALQRIDLHRSLIACGGIFSIQQNVTTAHDAAGEILLRRFYSSEGGAFPVNGAKRKTLTQWTQCLFVQGRVFVGEGEDVLARTFDDFDQMRAHQLRSVVNVPMMHGNLCYATFNVFGTRVSWQPEQILAIRLLALTAARWVHPVAGLSYSFMNAGAAAAAQDEPMAAAQPNREVETTRSLRIN
ncbi:GAF domain-containing protein [Variovorax ginsengisoli]|uniref:GAF domain-containing protein n=1 Tax=Variovorax ginsengisoli TaxID=363844 RepID=A0ABT8SF34_9BURK|nr:GAF domain-containing protein [Variovorax ginsengisoli]MDN8617774.1 GAF domain-containing protein [Variovorax ginsengisoli]MDO1536944.1 GAF domain-containing protein [Variovorax ginsengisoli]